MAAYPLPKFHFEVNWGGSNIGFTEVSGLDVETEVIEYRHGNSKEYFKTKQPGLVKYSNITCKQGTFLGDNEFFEWYKNNVNFENPDRRDIIIKLLGEDHAPRIVWTVKNAFITKVQSTDLKADGNEIAIQTMEIVHEGLEIIHV